MYVWRNIEASLCTIPHYLINDDFLKDVFEPKIFIFILSTIFVWTISRSKNNLQDIIINVLGSSCQVPVIIVRF